MTIIEIPLLANNATNAGRSRRYQRRMQRIEGGNYFVADCL